MARSARSLDSDPAAPPPRLRAAAWMAAARPRTLPAAATPVVLGCAWALHDGVFAWGPALGALLGALLIQIGTNLANDYYDHRRGADASDRLGPPRASASGWIRAEAVRAAAFASFALAGLVGLYLVHVAGWPILVIGVLSLASGYAYTGGPYPLGYHGWGDLFVFVFFGLVATTGTYFVQAGGPAPLVLLAAAVPLGCLSTAILVVNNLRDLETDRRAGKRTLAVRLGDRATRIEYALLLTAAFVAPPLLVAVHALPAPALLPGLLLPPAARLVRRVVQTRNPQELNPLLPQTAYLLAAFGALFSLGVIW